MIVITQSLIPGKRRIEAGRLVLVLIIIMRSRDRVILGAGIGVYILAVKGIDEPSQFVVLGVVAIIAQRDAEIKPILFVKDVYRLDGCVENLGCIEHARPICGRITAFVAEIYALRGSFFVAEMDVGQGKELQKLCDISEGCAAGISRQELPSGIGAGPELPFAIAVFIV